MKIPFVKSRNFDSYQIARSAVDVDIVGVYLTGYAHCLAQTIRDGLTKKFGSAFKGLTVTSSNRSAYNDSVKDAAANSHHEWRLEKNGDLHMAIDLKPHGITLKQLYDYCIANVRGEVYMKTAVGIVHVAQVPMEDEHWIQ